MQAIQNAGGTVCGVSTDRQERLAGFAEKYRLPFPLLSDRKGAVAARYGSLVNLGLFRLARRNTFLIDPGGRIAKRYLGVDPAGNADDVLADLRAMRR